MLVFSAPTIAADGPDLPAAFRPLDRLYTGTVTEVVDGDTVRIDNGREVRMVGIQAPKLPLGRAGFRKWPLADTAKAVLEALAQGHHFTALAGGQPVDRHGRDLAHLVDTDDGVWLQGEMLRLGLARVYSFPDNRALVAEMLTRERQARADGIGIWGHPFYAIRTPDGLANLINTFQIVEGRIVDAARVRSTVYLNFGADWRTDFTVSLDRQALRLFADLDQRPDEWTGRLIRVRGWLRNRNGPMIEASHPEQIELLDPAADHPETHRE